MELMLPPRLKIAIDNRLQRQHGNEIRWTLQTILAGIGYAWTEVSPDDTECDLLYTVAGSPVDSCRIAIFANVSAWECAAELRLSHVATCRTWEIPVYEGTPHVRNRFHFDQARYIFHHDVVFDVFWLLTGQEERHFAQNKHGHFSLDGTAQYDERVLRRALASGIALRLEQALEQLGFPPPHPRWPAGKRAAAAISHDVDYPEVVRWLEPFRIMRRHSWRGASAARSVLLGSRHHWQFGSWMEMEQRLGVRSAFYFCGRKGSLRQYVGGTPDPFYDVHSIQFRELLRILNAEGFEVGLHASYRSHDSLHQLSIEKRSLEQAAGFPVSGNRHHYWRLKADDPEHTLLLHERVGLTYDASLAHDCYAGWRRGSTWPFFPYHQKLRRPLQTLQLPTGWMDNHLFDNIHLNPGDRIRTTQSLARTVLEQGGLLLVDVHEYVFDDVLFPEWSATLRVLWESIRSQSEFWLATPIEVAEHWRKRHEAIAASSSWLGHDDQNTLHVDDACGMTS